jgi:hypothetical protein
MLSVTVTSWDSQFPAEGHQRAAQPVARLLQVGHLWRRIRSQIQVFQQLQEISDFPDVWWKPFFHLTAKKRATYGCCRSGWKAASQIKKNAFLKYRFLQSRFFFSLSLFTWKSRLKVDTQSLQICFENPKSFMLKWDKDKLSDNSSFEDNICEHIAWCIALR